MVLSSGVILVDCFYSSSNGGMTMRSGDVWKMHYPYYVKKTDEWDIAANREKPTRYGHGVGISQAGAMWAAKNGVPYQEILLFYYEGTTLVGNYGQGDPSSPAETEKDAELDDVVVHVKFMTRNDSYAYGRKIIPKGIMVHSTATPGVMAASWYARWNRSYRAGETTRQVSMHAFVDDMEIWQYLPWDQRAWHAAGTANDTHIAFEMCEPSGHTYASGGRMVNYSAAKQEAFFRAVWHNSVALCAMLCQQYDISVSNILGHYEGYRRGIANNHADPGQWFPQHKESMDTFRAAVKAMLDGGVAPPVPAPQPKPPPPPSASGYAVYHVKPGDSLWNIARDHLGSGSRHKEIMTLNNLTSDVIRIGQILLLPE